LGRAFAAWARGAARASAAARGARADSRPPCDLVGGASAAERLTRAAEGWYRCPHGPTFRGSARGGLSAPGAVSAISAVAASAACGTLHADSAAAPDTAQAPDAAFTCDSAGPACGAVFFEDTARDRARAGEVGYGTSASESADGSRGSGCTRAACSAVASDGGRLARPPDPAEATRAAAAPGPTADLVGAADGVVGDEAVGRCGKCARAGDRASLGDARRSGCSARATRVSGGCWLRRAARRTGALSSAFDAGATARSAFWPLTTFSAVAA
jgi:hypothetical protein